ncbi:Hypothetical protein MIP_04177 [Mycobacterium intracellulare subsp. intracellulare MTCC 9506]|uniref:Uncharacterized protein n=1 Tax=Mycobacterium indicus pranii (strain DSM 45239 / MTCC 9506) TaxID=1232724 RepID=J9WK23_MYCIP|nr:Hypothetical protein MIP_04177 [Mycobacterium intracellulare subsp. intracellulare MTCC 9506]
MNSYLSHSAPNVTHCLVQHASTQPLSAAQFLIQMGEVSALTRADSNRRIEDVRWARR